MYCSMLQAVTFVLIQYLDTIYEALAQTLHIISFVGARVNERHDFPVWLMLAKSLPPTSDHPTVATTSFAARADVETPPCSLR